ncbi:MAG: hypothetical protein ACHQ6T_11995 [Myxococcota bacterium]
MRRALTLALAVSCAACALFLPTPDDATRLAEWQRKTVSLRGLDFSRPVALHWTSRDEMPEVLRFEAADELEPARVAEERDGYAALGALAPDVDLGKELLALYASQAAGVYSPRRNTLFVADDMSGALKSLLLEPIVVHELTHALQDQNFPQVLDFLLGLDREDDVARALSGTIEGDASVTMLGAFPGASRENSVELAESLRSGLLAEVDKPDSEMGRAPRLLAVGLVFPYAYGTVVAARRYQAEGTAGLDAELADPPLATLRILRPDTRAPVEFVRLGLGALRAAPATAACTVGEDNVAGAVTLRVLFEATRKGGDLDTLLEGWRGDRYVKLSCGAKWELVWLTRWSSRESAQRFAAAYRELAPAIAARTPLSGTAEVVVRDATALVVTPGARPGADELLRASEIRSYLDFKAWVADGCFPETACPTHASRMP